MLINNLLVPVIMIGIGRIFVSHPPKKINYIYGYRTTRSMKNNETWHFAHNYCGRLWFKAGWFVLIISVLPMVFVMHQKSRVVGMVGGGIIVVQLMVLMGSIIPVERALKRRFDKDGNKFI